MKKIYLSLMMFASLQTMSAQTIVTFEDLSLANESYYDGADLAGGFVSNGVHFENIYNPEWMVWSGFSLSNTTDVTNGDYTNQYSAIAGSGVNASANYAVFYDNGKITFPQAVNLQSVKLTNTTYAGLTMLNGAYYAKQFGSINGADGNPDGTNGKDFFKVWIYGLDENGTKKDSVEFYLADYRFDDDNQDYIVNTWANVDLSTLQNVSALSFKFESSDVGEWGINTPTYFAMDDLTIQQTLGIDKINQIDVVAYPNPVVDELTVKGGNGTVNIYDFTGKNVFSTSHNELTNVNVSAFEKGMYLVELVQNGQKSTVKIIK